MACEKCEKCRLYKDKIETCLGQGVFDPKQCPIEKLVLGKLTIRAKVKAG